MIDVEVTYGKVAALKGISIRLRPGEIVTLLGANGAGKSTALKTISGVTHPRSGSITLEDRRIDTLSPSAIIRLGISQSPEGREIFPDLTVYENLKMGAYIRKDREVSEDIQKVLAYFPILRNRLQQPGGTLSGGEQQMLTIGRALLSRPRYLLLDEPSLGLAPKIVKQIFSILQTIHKTGVSILLVEQNANLALAIADYGYVLETGSVVLEGTGADLRNTDHVRMAYLGQKGGRKGP
jgi:branched-chain amino acid transport system ATP-binding protein